MNSYYWLHPIRWFRTLTKRGTFNTVTLSDSLKEPEALALKSIKLFILYDNVKLGSSTMSTFSLVCLKKIIWMYDVQELDKVNDKFRRHKNFLNKVILVNVWSKFHDFRFGTICHLFRVSNVEYIDSECHGFGWTDPHVHGFRIVLQSKPLKFEKAIKY